VDEVRPKINQGLNDVVPFPAPLDGLLDLPYLLIDPQRPCALWIGAKKENLYERSGLPASPATGGEGRRTWTGTEPWLACRPSGSSRSVFSYSVSARKPTTAWSAGPAPPASRGLHIAVCLPGKVFVPVVWEEELDQPSRFLRLMNVSVERDLLAVPIPLLDPGALQPRACANRLSLPIP
jgi:hypothetical protein